MNIKHVIGMVAGIAIIGAFSLSAVSCGGKLEKKVADAINDDGAISSEDYLALSKLYAEQNEDNDTTGFYDLVAEVFMDQGYSQVTILGDAPVKNLPKMVRVYLDNTSSMEGYLNPKDKKVLTTDFTDIFTRGIGHSYAGENIEAVYVNKSGNSKDVALKTVGFSDFCSMLTAKSIPAGDAFTMNALLDSIVSTAATDTMHSSISFLVTDGILAGTNEEIKKDPNFSLNNAGELVRRISDAMRKANKNGYGAAIYPFSAKFDGIYYRYDNGKEKLSNTDRPFYMIVIGDKALVKDFAENRISNFSPLNNHSILLTDGCGTIIPRLCDDANSEEETADGVRTFKVTPSEGKVKKDGKARLEFWFPVDRFPSHMRDLGAIKKGMKITFDGQPLDTASYVLKGNKVAVPFVIETGSQPEAEVILSNSLPAWVDSISISNDSAIKENPLGTFLFREFVDGMVKGTYDMKAPEIAKSSFIVDWQSGKTD